MLQCPGVSIEVRRIPYPLCHSLLTGRKALLTCALEFLHKFWVKIVILLAWFRFPISKNSLETEYGEILKLFLAPDNEDVAIGLRLHIPYE